MKICEITLTNNNKIKIKLFSEGAPKTVENFERLVEKGFYNGLSFFRVIPNFIVQTGCPYNAGLFGVRKTIPCETENNPNSHVTGAVSMAHWGKNTGSSMFFITLSPQKQLDGRHTVFGRVISGMDYVLSIRKNDKIKNIRMKSK